MRLDVNQAIDGFREIVPGVEQRLRLPPAELVDGTIREDAFLSSPLARFRNHFYNPLDGSGLHFYPLPGVNSQAEIRGVPSRTWGTEQVRDQEFSFKDARQSLDVGLPPRH